MRRLACTNYLDAGGLATITIAPLKSREQSFLTSLLFGACSKRSLGKAQNNKMREVFFFDFLKKVAIRLVDSVPTLFFHVYSMVISSLVFLVSNLV